MKTAMQELIDEMNEMLIEGNGSIYVLKEQARKLLKKEKKQMIDFAFAFSKDYTTAKEMRDYYKETFNTNEK